MMSEHGYIYPIESIYHPRITYDESPAHVGRLQHSVDFVVPVGTPIRAARDGVVHELKVDSDIGGTDWDFDEEGNYIELKHEDGEYSIYEHIQQYSVPFKVGDRVKAGQVIAYSGATGFLAHLGPHLHFNVHRYVGKSKDAYESVPIRWKNESSVMRMDAEEELVM